jgi:hypothetical protein
MTAPPFTNKTHDEMRGRGECNQAPCKAWQLRRALVGHAKGT